MTHVDFIARTDSNPFDIDPPCDRFVPGYGDTSAHFHVVGDNPLVHGGRSTGIPFTDKPWSQRFFETLQRADLVRSFDLAAGTVDVNKTFFSYLHACEPTDAAPGEDAYERMEPHFDAELRAITAHVLLPVGRRANERILRAHTPHDPSEVDIDDAHGYELRGSGWLVVPVKEPAEWSDGDADRLAAGLTALQQTDYRRVSDLGRFLPDSEPYFVR